MPISISRETGLIDQNLRKKNWKVKHFNVETPQSTIYYEWNAWVWDEMFFKITCIEPRSPKNKIFNQYFLKSQTSNTFCIKIKEVSILDGHNKITHNNKIFNQYFLKSQTSNTFFIKIKEFSILDGHNKITHNNMYKT